MNSLRKEIENGNLINVANLVMDNPILAIERGTDDTSPLMLALFKQHWDIAEFLRDCLPALDIYEASAMGDIEQLDRILSEYPLLINSYSENGYSPLHLACYFGRSYTAEILINRGANINLVAKTIHNPMPIHMAANNGHIEIVRLLLEEGVDPNCQQSGGWTALHAAARQGNEQMIETLIDSGANVNVISDTGETPLDLAKMKGYKNIILDLMRG